MDPSPFFHTIITIYYLLVLFTFLQTTIFYHSIRLILCSQQTGEIGNLTASWDKYLVVLCAGSMLLLVQSYALDKSSGTIVWSCRKASGHQPSEVWFFLLLV
jgi:hypothetical protein